MTSSQNDDDKRVTHKIIKNKKKIKNQSNILKQTRCRLYIKPK